MLKILNISLLDSNLIEKVMMILKSGIIALKLRVSEMKGNNWEVSQILPIIAQLSHNSAIKRTIFGNFQHLSEYKTVK